MLRRLCAVPQSLLADRAETSRQSLNQYELGLAFPSRRRAKAIDDALAEIIEERLVAGVRELPRPSEELTVQAAAEDPPDLEDQQGVEVASPAAGQTGA